MPVNRQSISRYQKEIGWRCYTASFDSNEAFSNLLLAFASRFGAVMAGRNGVLVEPIVPRSREAAEDRSLSAVYGLDELPMHIDTAHRICPARYLLIGCVEAGQSGAQTRLAHVRNLNFIASEISVLTSAPLLIRTGRKSFYSTILDKRRSFFRYDPGCMEPVDSRGEEALDIVRRAVERVEVSTHEWRRGEILLVDNWNVLHGRTATRADNRLLFRVSVQ